MKCTEREETTGAETPIEKWLKPQQVATILGLGRQQVINLEKTGKLQVRWIAGVRHFDPRAVEALRIARKAP